MKGCGNDPRGSESSQPALNSSSNSWLEGPSGVHTQDSFGHLRFRSLVGHSAIYIPSQKVIQHQGPSMGGCVREWRGGRPQGWPQETEQLDMDSHAVNHQPGIPKGRCTPTLPHMEICISRDVQGQAGHGWRLPRVMEEGLPTSSQPEPTHANWEWT